MLSIEILKNVFPLFTAVWSIYDEQLQRLMEQRHLSERDSKLMIGAQMNMDKKVTSFDLVSILYCLYFFVFCTFFIFCHLFVIGCPGAQAAMAQFVIENSGSLQDTHEQVLTN